MGYNKRLEREFPQFILNLVERVFETYAKKADIHSESISTSFNILRYNTVDSAIRDGESFIYRVEFKGSYKDDEGTEYELDSHLDIPRMVENIFIIKGARRVPITNIKNKFFVASDTLGTFEGLTYHIFKLGPHEFSVKDGDKEYNKFYYNNVNTEDYDEDFEIPVEGMDLFTEYERKLINFQLDLDLPLYNHLTKEHLISIFENRDKYEMDEFCNKNFIDVYSALMTQIKKNYNLFGNVSKLGRYKKLYLTDFQKAINAFFNMMSQGDKAALAHPLGENPQIIDALINKIKTDRLTLQYLTSFDIINPVTTPDNNNINTINSLNRNIEVRNGLIYIKVFNSLGKSVQLPYIDYLNGKILLSDNYDFINGKLKDQETYTIRFRKSLTNVAKKDLRFDYIEPPLEQVISFEATTSPMMNTGDPARTGIASRLNTSQSIVVQDSEPPKIRGSFEKIADSNSLIIRFDYNKGKVVKISDGIVYIKLLDSNEVVTYELPSPLRGIYDTCTMFKYKVKVGDTVNSEDPIFIPEGIKDGHYSIGKSFITALLNFEGLTEEDGIVVSDSVTLTNHSTFETPGIYFKNIVSVANYLTLGSTVTSSDILFAGYVEPEFNHMHTVSQVNKELKQDFSLYRKLAAPDKLDKGVIIDIDFQINPMFNKNNEDKEYQKMFHYDRKILESSGLPDHIIDLRLQDIDPFTGNNYRYKYFLKFKIYNENTLKVGDKLSNPYGGKGVISAIIPEDQMPFTKDGRKVQIILSPTSIFSRKSFQVISEMTLNNILNHFKTAKPTKVMVEVYNEMYGSKLTLTEFKKLDKDNLYLTVGLFSKFTPDYILQLVNKLGLENETRSTLYKTTKKGNKIKYKNPILVGDLYFYKLRMLAQYFLRVYNEELDPAMSGYLKPNPHSISEMDLWSLVAQGLEEFVEYQRAPTKEANTTNLALQLMMAGAKLTKDKLPLLTNPDHKLASALLKKFSTVTQ